MITSEQLAILSAPFTADEHEFKPPRGYVYIAEIAICERIESIDPSWEWRVDSAGRHDPRGNQATTVGHLTILGVTRSGVGMQAVEYQKGSETESGEAEKGAETDALKRAARKFGIGRYLLGCPKDVKGHGKEFNMWLQSLSRNRKPAPQEPTPPLYLNQAPMHWSMEDGALDRLYAWVLKEYKLTSSQVSKLIAASGKAITDLSKAELMSLIQKGAK